MADEKDADSVEDGPTDVTLDSRIRGRWRASFSLRCLFVLVTAFSIIFAWAEWKIRQGWRQQRAVELILSREGHWSRRNTVVYSYQQPIGSFRRRNPPPPGPAWLRKLLGEHCFLQVDDVSGHFDEESLKALAEFKKLRNLTISGEDVNDNAIRHISALHSVDDLQIICCPVTDDGLRHLEPLTQLTSLNLALDNMTDEGIRHLAPLRRLRFLQLNPPLGYSLESGPMGQITGVGFKYAPEFPVLEELRLSGLPIEDEALRYIARYKKLKDLDLGDTNVRGPGIRYLAQLPDLSSVMLNKTPVSDEAFEHLKELKQIRFLALPEGRISPTVFEELQAALPDCNVGLY